MRIIYQGVPKSQRLWRGTCSDCGTRVEFAQHEGNFTSSQHDGDNCTVVCPICGDPIIGEEAKQ